MSQSPESLASDVLKTLEMWRLPVDPLEIAREEGIELAPGNYSEGFDGRLEYLPEVGSFALYYREAGEGRSRGRMRFSIAHELGHYYLHSEDLESGLAHDSIADFRSKDPRERDADEFAAALLMPAELFASRVRRFRQQVCTLSELSELAEDVFQTSLTSTVRRYCQCDLEPCSVIITEDAQVKWAIHSYSMKTAGMSYVAPGSVPTPSKTAELWRDSRHGQGPEQLEGHVDAGVWFEHPYREDLWEEVITLGRTGQALTYLTVAQR